MKSQQITFLSAVWSRADLVDVVPPTPLAFAIDASKEGDNHFFVFANGAWGSESVCTAEQEANVKHGSEVLVQLADGNVSMGTFTVIDGVPTVCQHYYPKARNNYSERYYAHQRAM